MLDPTATDPSRAAVAGNIQAEEDQYEESLRALLEKSRKDPCARLLNESIPFNTTVLEVGCGAGKLSNFLGIACRRVFATDPSVTALRVGEAFRRDHRLSRVRFLQMDESRPCFRPGVFDVIVCSRALAQSAEVERSFGKLASLVRPGGHVVVAVPARSGRGGRRLHDIRTWFESAGLLFVRNVLPSGFGEDTPVPSLFERVPEESRIDRFVRTVKRTLSPARGDDMFLAIAQRPLSPSPITGSAFDHAGNQLESVTS
jgi:SAM-dependent methyltransferase